MSEGYIMLSRKFFRHWLWEDERREFSKAEAWIDLVRSASFADSKRLIRGKLIDVKRGECVASLRFLAERWGWSRTKVSAFMALLTEEGMTSTRKAGSETIVTLCKYEEYNSPSNGRCDSEEPEKDQKKAKEKPQKSQPSDKVEEGKEREEGKEVPPNPHGGDGQGGPRVLPSGWQKLKVAETKKTRVNCNSKLMIRIGQWFGRPAKTLWFVHEAITLMRVKPSEEEIQLVERYYTASTTEIRTTERDIDPRRKDLPTLLNNWGGEVDRARIWMAERGTE